MKKPRERGMRITCCHQDPYLHDCRQILEESSKPTIENSPALQRWEAVADKSLESVKRTTEACRGRKFSRPFHGLKYECLTYPSTKVLAIFEPSASRTNKTDLLYNAMLRKLEFEL
jgi:hypothetical protein